MIKVIDARCTVSHGTVSATTCTGAVSLLPLHDRSDTAHNTLHRIRPCLTVISI